MSTSTTTCTTCGATHDSGMDETVTECPACPESTGPTEWARTLADCVDAALTRLAEDLTAIAGIDLSAAPEHERGRAEATVSESRRMAAGALERLWRVSPGIPEPTLTAEGQMLAIRRAEAFPDATTLRAWAAAWRAFADT